MPNTDTTLPRALGLFSLGLGTVQVLAPGALTKLIGLKNGKSSKTVMRLVGVRELGAAAGVLTRKQSAPWLWSRVAGDAMDLGLLGAAVMDDRNDRARLSAALGSVIGVTAADVLVARRTMEAGESGPRHLRKAITIRRSQQEVYRFWRDFRNFPTFMSHLESVAVLDDQRSHWTAKGPAGRLVEWDAEIVEDRPNELIRWRSLADADVANSGTVRFNPAPGSRGTEARLDIDYEPPAGALGSAIARLFGQEPSQQVQADLRKLKEVLETGEVLRSEATIVGTHIMQRPAQPQAQSRSEARS